MRMPFSERRALAHEMDDAWKTAQRRIGALSTSIGQMWRFELRS